MIKTLKNARYMQYLSATTSTLTMASVSTFLVWPSPTLPFLASNESLLETPLTDEQGSWIVSSLSIAPLPFTFITGWLMDKFGRKSCLLFASVPLAVPWIIIIFAKSFVVICLARALAGCGVAFATVGCAIYNAEIADNDIRGRLSTIYIIMMLVGSLMVLSVGPFASYQTLALVCLSVPILFAIIFYFMPESPYYLVKVGQREEAKQVLLRIAPNEDKKNYIEEKMYEIEKTIESNESNKSNVWELFTNREHRRPLIIILGLKLLQQFSGLIAIEPYMQTIVEATDSSISPEISSIIFGLVQFPSVLFTSLYVDKIGRKPLIIVSAIGCAVTLTVEGIYFYMQDVVHSDLSKFSWLPTTGIVAFLFVNTLGATTLPVVLLGELFATNIKGVAISVVTFYSGILAFVITKFFQPLSNRIGIYSLFWLFAVICALGSLFVYFVVPETKGKSFADIQAKLKRKWRTKNDIQA